MKRLLKAGIIPLGISAFIVLMWVLLKDATIDVLQPTGQVAQEQRNLLFFTLGLSVLVIVPVFTMLGVFAYRYREGRGADYKPELDGNNKLEAIWWGIPIAIIGVLAVVTWQTSNSLDPYKAIESDKKTLEVQVVALQWKWLFLYPEYELATINELPLPVDRPVHFSLAADAPMSAFWIPSLGSQIYSMNGMGSQLNLLAKETGEFTGYNTNINGEGYSDMTFTAKVMSDVDFTSWAMTEPGVAMKANRHLDMTMYDMLAQPSIIPKSQTYHLMDIDMYDKIMAKYMGHGHGGSDSGDTGTHETMDHSEHTMQHEGAH